MSIQSKQAQLFHKLKPDGPISNNVLSDLCTFARSAIGNGSQQCNKNPLLSLRKITKKDDQKQIFKVLAHYLVYRPQGKRFLVQGVQPEYLSYNIQYFDFASSLDFHSLLDNVASIAKNSASDSAIYKGILYGQPVYVKDFKYDMDHHLALLNEKEIYRYLRSLQQSDSDPIAAEYRKYFITMLLCIMDRTTQRVSILTEDSGGLTVTSHLQDPSRSDVFVVKVFMDMLYSIYLLQQAHIIHNDYHIGNVLLVDDDQADKTYPMFGKTYSMKQFPHHVKVYDFDWSSLNLPNHISQSRTNPQKDIFNWLAVWEWVLHKTRPSIASKPWFKKRWARFQELLRSYPGYNKLRRILAFNMSAHRNSSWQKFCDVVNGQYVNCNEISLDVLDLSTVLDAYYSAFQDILTSDESIDQLQHQKQQVSPQPRNATIKPQSIKAGSSSSSNRKDQVGSLHDIDLS